MIGIDISDKSIKVVQLANGKDHRLLRHGFQVLSDGIIENGMILKSKEASAALAQTLQQSGIGLQPKDAVVASIPETQSFLRVIEIPAMQEDEVGEAVRWEVAQHIPFGLDNVYIDWQPLSQGHVATAGRLEVQVGAAQKKVIDLLQSVFATLQLDVAAFELESQAITRALISSELKDRQGLLIVDLGASATNVVVHDHGAMRFTASLQKGAQQLRAVVPQMNGVKEKGKDEELSAQAMALLAPVMEELVVEVKGIVEFYNSIDEQHDVKEIILTGGGSNLPGLDKAFLKYFDNVHIQRGNPWVNILSPRAQASLPMGVPESVRYTTALGLALRPVLM